MPGVENRSFEWEKTIYLSGLLTKTGLREMLEGMDYQSVHMVFSFVKGYTSGARGCIKAASLTCVHSSYFMFAAKMIGQYRICDLEEQENEELHSKPREFKGFFLNIFREQCGFRLYGLFFISLTSLQKM